MKPKVLLVEDQADDANQLLMALNSEDFTVVLVGTLKEAVDAFSDWPDVIVLDGVFPDRPGSAETFMAGRLLSALEEKCDLDGLRHPDIIFVSGHDESVKEFSQVIRWLHAGSLRDIVPKNMADAGLALFRGVVRYKVDELIKDRQLASVKAAARSAFGTLGQLDILTQDPNMMRVCSTLLKAIANSDANILLLGETGTGKGLLARKIHALSSRSAGPFVKISVPAIPAELLESELFGREKGAFTSAHDRKQGLLEKAKGGTVFLDEIGSISVRVQDKLLEFIDEKKFRRLGGTGDIALDVRIVAATSRDLGPLIQSKCFVPDLYYRLSTFEIALPPLRDRAGDVDLLTNHFLSGFNKKYQKDVSFAPEVFAVLTKYAWPGNVRELESFVERNVVLHEGCVGCDKVQFSGEQARAFEETKSAVPRVFNGSQIDSTVDLGDQSLLRLELPDSAVWLALTEKDEERILRVLHSRYLSAEGSERLLALERWLADRGNNNQDPKAIHHYKALLFLALNRAHSGSMSDFQQVLGLHSYEQKSKTLDNLKDPGGMVEFAFPKRTGKATKFVLMAGMLKAGIQESSETVKRGIS